MTNISGVRTTRNIEQQRLVVDMAKDIALNDPNDAPFITVLKLAKEDLRVAYNPKFEWLEDDLITQSTQVATAIAANSTTALVVDDATIFRVGDVIHIPSVGENMLVTAIDAANDTLTVTRGYGTTAAASAIALDATVLNLGPAMPENSSDRGSLSTKEAAKYNYTQIFRTPFALSGTEAASKLYGGKDKGYQRRKALLEHKRDIAKSLYFGQRKEDTTGATPRRTMGGLLSFLTNTVAFDATTAPLSYKTFDQKVAREVFKHGSQNKLLIAGPRLLSNINDWAEAKLTTDVGKTSYGMAIRELITGYGNINVIYDPLLGACGRDDCGIVVDTDYVRYVYLDTRDTKLNTNIQNNDVDGEIDEYITECSIEVKLPDTHMLITGCYDPS